MENKNVPSIRFKGFIDDWEQRKLKNIANYRNGKAHEKVEDINGKFTIINSRFISIDGKVKRHTNEQVEPMLKGEIAMVLSDLPNGKALAKVFLVDKDEKYTLNQRIAGITPKENMDSIFLSYRMNRNPYFLKFDSGVSQTNLSKPEVENFEALYPKKEEQTKIGNFFKQLDETITLQERELELLKLTKKSFLQQLFPKTNQRLPNIRFTNFHEDWEQRKLEGLAEYYDGTHQTPRYQESGVPFISVENIKDINNSNKYISKEDYKKDFKIKPQINDIFMTRITAGVIGDTAILTNSDDMAYYVSLALIRASKINPLYLEKYINNFEFKKELHKKIIHTAFPKKINLGDLGTCLVKFPHSFEEQTKIGNFFKQLDETIILQENKLENLRNVKSAFLQKMFI
ncbi:restriction endonuclease subunit S [Vagococcus fluvialis]|uniref:restriction endonuclease subunit S n=1 Tax=Vagococcus fluvialis TaxID=2738 RepID=UPI003D0B8A86